MCVCYWGMCNVMCFVKKKQEFLMFSIKMEKRKKKLFAVCTPYVTALLFLNARQQVQIQFNNWVASRENLLSGFPTRSDTNQAAQPQA